MATPNSVSAARRLGQRALAVAAFALLFTSGVVSNAALPAGDVPVTETAHFTFHGSDEVRTSLVHLASEAESRFARICASLGACDALDGRIEVWVAEDPERFAAAFPGESPMAEWAAGVAFIKERRLVLRAHGSALFSLRETFDHEVAHLLIHGAASGRHVPRWASEGLAIWASGEDVVARLDAAHRAAVFGNLLPLDALDARFPDRGSRVALAYAQSALFTRHLIGRFGVGALPRVLARVGGGEDFDAAFVARFGAPAASLALDWAEALEADASPFILLHDGSFLWLLMTFAFVYVGIKQHRQRKAALADMDDGDDDDRAGDLRVDADVAFRELEEQRAQGEPPTIH